MPDSVYYYVKEDIDRSVWPIRTSSFDRIPELANKVPRRVGRIPFDRLDAMLKMKRALIETHRPGNSTPIGHELMNVLRIFLADSEMGIRRRGELIVNVSMQMIREVVEFLDSVPHTKNWKTSYPKINRPEMVFEFVDIYLFFQELQILMGITNEEFYVAYKAKFDKNLIRAIDPLSDWNKPV